MTANTASLPKLPDKHQLQQAMLHLDLAVYAPLRGVLAEYVQFYGLDFEKTMPGVRHYQGWYEADGYRIAAHVFLPESPRGTVFILHGYLDHSGSYRHLVRDCLGKGFAVFIYDQPGHGLSGGECAEIPDFDSYQQVLNETINTFSLDLPAPFYATGLSMGGGILMDYLLSSCARGNEPVFRKVLLLAPLIRPAHWQQARLGYSLVRFLRRSMPRTFRQNSSDTEFIRFIRKDPLQAQRLPLSWVGALSRWETYMQGKPAYSWPVLLVQGDADETVDWRYNNQYVRQHFHVIHEAIVPAASHQLPNERDDLRQPVHTALAVMLGA